MTKQPCPFCGAPDKKIGNEVGCDVCGMECSFMVLDKDTEPSDIHNTIARALGEKELDHDS